MGDAAGSVGCEALMREISQRSEEIAPDYLYNDIGPLFYAYSASPYPLAIGKNSDMREPIGNA